MTLEDDIGYLLARCEALLADLLPWERRERFKFNRNADLDYLLRSIIDRRQDEP